MNDHNGPGNGESDLGILIFNNSYDKQPNKLLLII